MLFNISLTTNRLVYRALLFFNLVIFATAAYAIPLVGPAISFLYACWTAAFYSFEQVSKSSFPSPHSLTHTCTLDTIGLIVAGPWINVWIISRHIGLILLVLVGTHSHCIQTYNLHFILGLPSTVVTFFFPQFVSYGIFALLFPLFVIMSSVAKPIPSRRHDITKTRIPRQLPVFSPAKRMNLIWIRHLNASHTRATQNT
jgi:hypothetical protein